MNLTFEQVVIICGFLIFAVEVVGKLLSTRKAVREEKAERDRPIAEMKAELSEHRRMLENDQRRIDALQNRINDTNGGLMAICEGVQALLNHELHDGNSEEMAAANNNLNKWLFSRKTGG